MSNSRGGGEPSSNRTTLWEGWTSRLFFVDRVTSPSTESVVSAAESIPNLLRNERLPPSTMDPSCADVCDQTAWTKATTELFRQCRDDSQRDARRQICHIRQLKTWDCGIACLQMVANWLGILVRRDEMLRTVATESIWTVDLMHIFQEWKDRYSSSVAPFSYLFCSKTLTLNEALSDATYYISDFEPDRIRVSRRLQSIRDENWPALQMSHLSMARVLDCIQRKDCVAIALVDNHIHDKSVATQRAIASDESTSTSAKRGQSSLSSYVGHFILLAGISSDPKHLAEARSSDLDGASSLTESLVESTGRGDGDTNVDNEYCLVVHNPGCDVPVSYWTIARFERAWRADGTDEDILFVARHSS